MKSIKGIYKIGRGPSSSHTMGPQKAASIFLQRHTDAASFEVTLYGSLAATGKGHMTDVAVTDVLSPVAPVNIVWHPDIFLPFHPNGMKFVSFDSAGKTTDEWTVYSIGGGDIAEESEDRIHSDEREVYELSTISQILSWCMKNGKNYWEYVLDREESDLMDYLSEVWKTMRESVERGLDEEGVLPGPLHLPRKAARYYIKASAYTPNIQNRALVYAYALAVSEENAAGGTIVTAPTCGSSGVLPAVLYHQWKNRSFSEKRILHALATAALFGNVVKHNASVSGADVGCQGEIP